MKKTIPTSINNILFHIEEDGFEVLARYLAAIRTHFEGTEDGAEIIRDIENRVAEQFIEHTGGAGHSRERIITAAHVAALIQSMGEPGEFDDTIENETAQASGAAALSRKLYRDIDQAIIGGVAAGLAAYFGIQVVYVRLLFLASIFFGGTGVVVYLVLWLAMPPARTASQKLEMRGEHVTLESVSEVVRARMDEMGGRSDTLSKIIRYPFELLGHLFSFLWWRVFPFIRKGIGIAGIAGSVAALVVLISLFLIASLKLFGDPLEATAEEIFTGSQYYLVLIAGLGLFGIPAILLGMCGEFLRSARLSSFSKKAGGILVVLWLASIVGSAVLAASVQESWRARIAADPQYQQVTQELSQDAFENLQVEDSQQVRVVPGEEYSVTLSGYARDLPKIEFAREEETLIIRRAPHESQCVFCPETYLEVTVTTPALTYVEARDGSSISLKDWRDDAISIAAEDSGRIYLAGKVGTVTASARNNSSIELAGVTHILSAEVGNYSHLSSRNLTAQEVSVEVENSSRAEVYATESLSGYARINSQITQYGTAPTDALTVSAHSTIDAPFNHGAEPSVSNTQKHPPAPSAPQVIE